MSGELKVGQKLFVIVGLSSLLWAGLAVLCVSVWEALHG